MKPLNVKRRIGAGISVALILGLTTFVTSCKKDDSLPATPSPPQSSAASLQGAVNFQTTRATADSVYTVSKPINLTGAHDITISGQSINGGSVPAITLSNCYNVHITQNSLGNSTDAAIDLYHCYNITVDYNYISHVAVGVYVDHSTGGGTVVNNNQFLNMQGPFPRGQFCLLY